MRKATAAGVCDYCNIEYGPQDGNPLFYYDVSIVCKACIVIEELRVVGPFSTDRDYSMDNT